MSNEKTINIGTVINLNDLIKSRMLIQANSGGGKSAIARVIMEECYGKVPFIVMDIDGEYCTLKELHGDIIIIGGQHADVPITVPMARQLPKFIIEHQLSVVIDVSDLKMTERISFAKIFIESLMSLPQQYWVPYLIFLEECHKLAGEQDKYESGPAIKDLMSRGRKRGYCGIPITQRISKLHKDVAAECNNKFIGRTNLDIDMDRSAKELGFSKAADRLKLRDLKPGSFYAFGTSIEPQYVHEVKIKMPLTKMPQTGMAMAIQTKAPTGKIISILGKLNEELKKDEPKKTVPGPSVNPSPADVSKMEAMKKEMAGLNNLLTEKETELLKWKKLSVQRGLALNKIYAIAADAEQTNVTELESNNPKSVPAIAQTAIKSANNVKKVASNATPPPVRPVVKITNDLNLGKCSREIIKFLVQYRDRQFSKAQVAIATGYSAGSGGFNNSLSELNQKGFILRNGKLQANAEALPEIFATVGEIPDKVYDISTYTANLGKCEKEIYEVLLQYPDNEFTKEELSQRTETAYSSGSGGFNNSLSRLNTLELIERNNGKIRLNPELLELM